LLFWDARGIDAGMSTLRKSLAILTLVAVAGCGVDKPTVKSTGPTPEQMAATAELEKERLAIAEERKSLTKERESFRAEQLANSQKLADREAAIMAATKAYDAATDRRAEMVKAQEEALAKAEAIRKYKEDAVLLSSLKTLDRERLRRATSELRAGRLDQDQAHLLLQFHEYRDAVIKVFDKVNAGILTRPAGLDEK
jgi:hypothetical protein